jgi:hypothetical protein
MQVATLAASRRQQSTVTNDVLPSAHSPLARSIHRGVQATRMLTCGTPLRVSLDLGSLATYPVRLSCASFTIAILLGG